MSCLLRRTAAAALAVGGAGLLVLAAAVPASAQAASGPVQVSVSGPPTGEAGGTGTVTVGVRNPGAAPVDDLRLAPVLPDGVTVVEVSASDDWACVLGPLSCTLERRLTGGSATGTLQVELAYDGLVEGPQELAFVAVQGERQGAVRIDRGSTVVQVAPEPEPTPAPAAASPAPAATATAAPAPAADPALAATRAPGPALSPTASALSPAPAPAPAPVTEPAEPAGPAPDEVAPAESAPAGEAEQQAPAVLPFADTGGAGGDTTQDAERTALAAGSTAQGVVPVLTALAVGIPLALGLGLLARTAARRRGRSA